MLIHLTEPLCSDHPFRHFWVTLWIRSLFGTKLFNSMFWTPPNVTLSKTEQNLLILFKIYFFLIKTFIFSDFGRYQGKQTYIKKSYQELAYWAETIMKNRWNILNHLTIQRRKKTQLCDLMCAKIVYKTNRIWRILGAQATRRKVSFP